MSKQPPPDEAFDLPPPYSPTAAGPSTESSSIFSSQLANLRFRVLDAQASHASALDQRDNQVLALIVPHIETMVSSVAAMNPSPTLAEAILVPAEAAGDEWTLSDEPEPRPGEVRKVVRVAVQVKVDGKADGKAAQAAQSAAADGWGWNGGADRKPDSDPLLWWEDEAMARRLARSLQPERPAVDIPQDRDVAPAQTKQKKTSRWKLFNTADGQPSSPSPGPSTPPRRESENTVTMSVKAEEIAFRRENDFGIWESKSGYGIVVRLRLPRA
ncbi:hypothetical protein S7711_05030 [Stachybotrys chartarum IBT 7711]|uniref:Uncharacterized protein n=1 Tax=Stachybotrys chartarum (strain CBS 109288 / IBT 7711) TaxID=1280523 RepID=A0A084BAM0_STACB|nr:hypothetical protein S7711_05030 [Stachybotrys chartarum IBT 7711]KFA51382.1 hypothetical protein S40293_03275 [Stachybotrys chartarum IBT 40293]